MATCGLVESVKGRGPSPSRCIPVLFIGHLLDFVDGAVLMTLLGSETSLRLGEQAGGRDGGVLHPGTLMTIVLPFVGNSVISM